MSESNNTFKNFVDNYKYQFFIGITSLLIGLIALYVSLQEKRPYYTIRSFNLIGNSSSTISNLDIKYKSEPIQSLTTSKIMLWNGGRKTIESTDIAPLSPIQITTKNPDTKILEANIIQESISNKVTNIKLDSLTNHISFDFLESGDGVVIEVLHTGLSGYDIELKGYIKDSKFKGKIKLIYFEEYNKRVLSWSYNLTRLSLLSFLLFLLFLLTKEGKIKRIFVVVLPLFCLTLVSLLIVMTLTFFYNKIMLRVPKKSYQIFTSEVNLHSQSSHKENFNNQNNH